MKRRCWLNRFSTTKYLDKKGGKQKKEERKTEANTNKQEEGKQAKLTKEKK